MAAEAAEPTVLPAEETEKAAESRKKPKKQPPYAVILHNDDINGFLFVVESIIKVFGYEPEKALKITMTAHESGKSCVWSGMREHAELKADQLRSCGADPEQAHKNALPLKVTTEPLPG